MCEIEKEAVKTVKEIMRLQAQKELQKQKKIDDYMIRSIERSKKLGNY